MSSPPPPPSMSPPSSDFSGPLLSCSCNAFAVNTMITVTAPCLNHVLYHQTTRTPLYVHPAFWSDTHLAVLRVVTTSSPPPSSQKQFPRKPPSSQDAHCSLLRRIHNPLPYFDTFRDIMCLIDSIINSVQRPLYPIFQIFLQVINPCLLARDYGKKSLYTLGRCVANLELSRFPQKQLEFRLGSIAADIEPRMHIEHTDQRNLSVPFLAYNDPKHRRLQKQLNTRSRRLEEQLRWGLAPVSSQGNTESVDPFDVSVLLAMAQIQERMLPLQTVYKTYLLFPNDAGTHVNLLAAQISARYLECFRDSLLPLTDDFIIDRSEVVISETGEELTNLVHGVLGLAPTLPLTERKRIVKLPAKKALAGNKNVKGK